MIIHDSGLRFGATLYVHSAEFSPEIRTMGKELHTVVTKLGSECRTGYAYLIGVFAQHTHDEIRTI